MSPGWASCYPWTSMVKCYGHPPVRSTWWRSSVTPWTFRNFKDWKRPSKKLTFPSTKSENHLFSSIRVKFQTKTIVNLQSVPSQYNLFRLMCIYMNLINKQNNHCTRKVLYDPKKSSTWGLRNSNGAQPNQCKLEKKKKKKNN